MKNLSHAVIRPPARYHDSRRALYFRQVVVNNEVSSRLKSNVVAALRLVVRNGADVKRGDIIGHSSLLLAFDPVAVDTVGLETPLNRRRSVGLTEELTAPYIAAASEAGVGRSAVHATERTPTAIGP